MTINEAVELILQASSAGLREETERGTIFILDMGEPIKIIDLAQDMIRLAGLQPEKDVGIEIIGLRPGERLEEQLFSDEEERLQATVPGVLVARSTAWELKRIEDLLDEVLALAAAGVEDKVRTLVNEFMAHTRKSDDTSAPRPAAPKPLNAGLATHHPSEGPPHLPGPLDAVGARPVPPNRGLDR